MQVIETSRLKLFTCISSELCNQHESSLLTKLSNVCRQLGQALGARPQHDCIVSRTHKNGRVSLLFAVQTRHDVLLHANLVVRFSLFYISLFVDPSTKRIPNFTTWIELPSRAFPACPVQCEMGFRRPSKSHSLHPHEGLHFQCHVAWNVMQHSG